MPPLFARPPSVVGYQSHALHGADRVWLETNCYIDLWVELLHSLGHDPLPALAFTVGQDLEGDQFTFFKFPAEDLEELYGLRVQELAVYDRLEAHVALQLGLGRVVLVEVDSFHLPDTAGTAYGREHVKTTIGIIEIDIDERRLGYFHNTACHRLEGEDFDGLFRRLPHQAHNPELLFPYAELVKRVAPAAEGRLGLEVARNQLARHLARRPASNPLRAFADALPAQMAQLATRPMAWFHLYGFNVLRQLGANFELLASHAGWLRGMGEAGLEPVIEAATSIAQDAKALQFQLARAVHKRRFDDHGATVLKMAEAYDRALDGLARRYG